MFLKHILFFREHFLTAGDPGEVTSFQAKDQVPNLRDSKIIISPDSTVERKMLKSGLEGRLLLLGELTSLKTYML